MLYTLNKRLIFSHLIVALVSVVLVYAIAGQAIFRAAHQQAENRLEDLAFATSNALEDPMEKFLQGESSLTNIQVAVAHWLADEADLHYTVYLPDGTPIIDNVYASPSFPNIETDPEIFLAIQDRIGEGDVIRLDQSGTETLYVAVRIEHEDELLGILRLGIPYQNALAPARGDVNTLMGFAVMILIGVGLAGWLLARNLASPIVHLTETTKRLTHGNLEARAIPAGPQELHLLAENFNSMAGRLQEHVDNLRTFVANASHELRTPLTSIKLRVEALRGGALDDAQTAQRFLGDIESEVDRLTAMVNDLLDLSKIESEFDRQVYETVDLGLLIREVCEIFSVRAKKSAIKLQHQVEVRFPFVLGNEDQLRRVLDNLIINALNYTPENGTVELRLNLAPNTGWLHLEVEDTGRGIAARHIPHIFERFYRIDQTRPLNGRPSGTGLGLAIVQSIIEAHHGTVSVKSAPGEGTTFTIELPSFQGVPNAPQANSDKW